SLPYSMERQKREDAVALARREAAPLHIFDAIDAKPGEDALALGLRRAGVRLPFEAIGHEDESPLIRQIGHLANGDERILEDRRDHREIFVVGRAQLQPRHRALLVNGPS